jgi:hypothetical protein
VGGDPQGQGRRVHHHHLSDPVGPLPATVLDVEVLDVEASFERALAHWRAGRAREAHEAWEEGWRRLPRESAEALFLKGLLCGTAYVVKRAEGSPVAHLLLERAEAAFARTGPSLGGVDARAFLAEVLVRAERR